MVLVKIIFPRCKKYINFGAICSVIILVTPPKYTPFSVIAILLMFSLFSYPSKGYLYVYILYPIIFLGDDLILLLYLTCFLGAYICRVILSQDLLSY